jgi:ribosomal protein S18 acetylase RimI-like enzyme
MVSSTNVPSTVFASGRGREPVSQGRRITLRPVEVADEAFLLQVYTGTRTQELALVPWNDEQKAAFVRMQFEAQRRHYAAEFPGAAHNIICHNEIPVGRLYVARLPEVLHIADITVLPQHRNAGIGSYLLGELLREAAQAGKPVRIYVESFNPSLRLFERLGFLKTKENGFHFLMEWNDRVKQSSPAGAG